MKKWRVLVLFCLFLAQVAYSSVWRDLWLTPDQKAQQLMQQGLFKQAAEKFQDGNWRAAAAYRAGDYEQAAALWSAAGKEQSDYNQGNALARLGRYSEAIKAYDRALQANPQNKDAAYNRQLVADAMKKNQQNQQNQENSKQNQNDSTNKNQEKSDEANPADQKINPPQTKQLGKSKQVVDEPASANKELNEKTDATTQDEQKKEPSAQDQKPEEKKPEVEPEGKPTKDKSTEAEPQQSAEAESKTAQQSMEEREKQRAKDQWLRLIPDEPGGLLRQKFLRDHLRRQSEGGL